LEIIQFNLMHAYVMLRVRQFIYKKKITIHVMTHNLQFYESFIILIIFSNLTVISHDNEDDFSDLC